MIFLSRCQKKIEQPLQIIAQVAGTDKRNCAACFFAPYVDELGVKCYCRLNELQAVVIGVGQRVLGDFCFGLLIGQSKETLLIESAL